MSIVVLFALRHALDSARKDAGVTNKWFDLGLSFTFNIVAIQIKNYNFVA